jgi:hypothetical protein
MRGIVIAKLLILTLWALYLAIALAQPTRDGGSASGAAARIRCLQQQSLIERNQLEREADSVRLSKGSLSSPKTGRPKRHQDGLLRLRTSSANCMSSAASMSDTAR